MALLSRSVTINLQLKQETNMSNLDVINALNEPTPKNRIKFRIGFKNRSNTRACMLGYVDARYVMDRLDSAVGKDNWSASYQVTGDTMFCTIKVTWPDGQVTEKCDCGTETDVDAEKGQASDAFKRAAVHYGIGRDLYSMGDFWAVLDANGNVDRDWRPEGWDSSSMNSGQDGSSSDPITTATASQPPTSTNKTAQDIADRIAKQERANEAENSPKNDETQKIDTKTPLKQGTPPEDESVEVKNLTKITESAKAVLMVPPEFYQKEGADDKDGNQTKQYWIPKQYIYSDDQMMNGKHRITVARWIAEQTLDNGEPKYTIDSGEDVPF